MNRHLAIKMSCFCVLELRNSSVLTSDISTTILWPDNSIKWCLVKTQVNLNANESLKLQIEKNSKTFDATHCSSGFVLETDGYKGDAIFISHYNNQYDPIDGFLRQFALTGDTQWFELADDLAHHVVDIDIHHSQQDKDEYNGGLFWHTDHYLDAASSSHHSDTITRPLRDRP